MSGEKNKKRGEGSFGQLLFLGLLLGLSVIGIYWLSKDNAPQPAAAMENQAKPLAGAKGAGAAAGNGAGLAPQTSPSPPFPITDAAKPVLMALQAPTAAKTAGTSSYIAAPKKTTWRDDPRIEKSPYRDEWRSNLERESRSRPQIKGGRYDDLDREWLDAVAEAQGRGSDMFDLYGRPYSYNYDADRSATGPANPNLGEPTSSSDRLEQSADSGNKALLGTSAFSPAGGPAGRGKKTPSPASVRTATETATAITPARNKGWAGYSSAAASEEAPNEANAEAAAKTPSEKFKPLDPFHAVVLAPEGFQPGFTYSNQLIEVPGGDLLAIVSGPPDAKSLTDDQAFAHPETALLSLGLGGTITLEVAQGGILRNEAGPDLVVYENPMRILDARLRKKYNFDYFIETGEVSVYGEGPDGRLRWYTFPCDASRYPYRGCAGTKLVYYPSNTPGPMAFGGDVFDLSDVGGVSVDRVRKIRIKDIGGNNCPPEFQEDSKAGFDLDSVALLHAYLPVEEPAP